MTDLTLNTEPDYLIDGFLEEGTLVVVSAGPNTGKTAMSLALAKGIITGDSVFGMNIRKRSGCTFLQYDMSPKLFTRYNALYAPSCPVFMAPGEVLVERDGVASFDFLNLMDPDVVADIAKCCKEDGVGVIFIDTLSTAFRDVDENNNNQMSKVMGSLKQLALQGFTVIVLHHVAKTEGGYGTSTRGASAIEGSADSVIKLRQSNRKINDNYVIDVEVSKTRSAPKGYRFSFTCDAFGIRKVDVNKEPAPSRIIEAFKKAGVSAMSRADLRTATGIGNVNLARELDTLVDAKRLTKDKVGKQDVYTLVDTVPEP